MGTGIASNMTLNLLLSKNPSATMKAGDKDMQKLPEFIPLSKLNRGQAGKILSDVKRNNTVKVIVKNNEAEAVIISVDKYNELLDVFGGSLIYKPKTNKAEGSLHKYAKPEYADKNVHELYREELEKKYAK